MIWPSLAFDGSMGEETGRNLNGIRGYLYNSQRRSFKPKISPSRDVDSIRKEDDVKRVEDVGGFENVQQPSKLDSACICGMFSVTCCRRKRMLSKIEEVRSSFAAVPKADFEDGHTSERLHREDRH
ncbi:hypothetical protein ACROYT_G022819 [Oculina patagonica]